jgi:hypothetical protein
MEPPHDADIYVAIRQQTGPPTGDRGRNRLLHQDPPFSIDPIKSARFMA